MNKKYAIVSIVLIAVMALALVPASRAFQTGPGSSPTNTQYNQFGPQASTLIIEVYLSSAAMIVAFQNQNIDFLDAPMAAGFIASNPAFTFGNVPLTQLREFDMNNLVGPFNVTAYRLGLASCLDRNQWITTYFPGGGLPAYTPLQSMGGWADPTLGPPAAISKNFLLAYGNFCQAEMVYGYSGAPILDANNASGLGSTWYFPNSYPTVASNPNPTPYDDSGPAVAQNQILFYIKATTNERYYSGVYLIAEAGMGLADYFANPANALAIAAFFAAHPTWKYPGYGTLNPKFPEIDFLPMISTPSFTDLQVMTYYRFQLYTGGWTTGSTPDLMEVWQSYYTPAAGNWAPDAYNFGSVSNPVFDNYVNEMLVANITYAHTLADYAQEVLVNASYCGVIPFWIYAGVTATLTSDYDAVNALGVGFGNWYSFLDAYPTSGSPGYGSNSLIWGWEGDMHSNANPISATGTWDLYMIGEIYDKLISENPYDPSQFLPGLADNYSVSVNPSVNGGNTVITFNLRNDVWWQDVPYMDRSAYTVDHGTELNGPFQNIPLTVLDVAYTYEMARDFGGYASVHINPDALDVDHVVVSSVWQSAWPWSTTNDPPWYNSTYAIKQGGWAFGSEPGQSVTNFVQFDPTLDSQTIKLYLTDQMTWLAYYTDMSIPIYPLHIFEYLACGGWMHNGVAVPNVYTMNLSPMAGGANLEYGTGPFIWIAGTPGMSYTMIAYKQGQIYDGLTEQNSYYWYPPVRVSNADPAGISGGVLWQKLYLTNFSPNNAYQVQVTGQYYFIWYNQAAMAWQSASVFGQTGPSSTLPVTVTVPAGATNFPVYLSSATDAPGTPPLVRMPYDTYICIWTAYTVQILSGNLAGLTIRGGSYNNLGQPMWDSASMVNSPYGTSRTYAVIDVHQGDIFGAAQPYKWPYIAADGQCYTQDITIICNKWHQYISHSSNYPIDGPNTDSNAQKLRADINGDGYIDQLDLTMVVISWYSTIRYLWPRNGFVAPDPPGPTYIQ